MKFTFADALRLVACIIVSELAGFIGSIFTISSIPTWYAMLNKPVFNPPAWVFAPVWTFLYLLMGISLFLVWRVGAGNKKAVISFFAQLSLNVVWSVVFFGFRSPLAGLIVIVLLWLAIVLTMASFSRLSRPAVLLFVPYVMWVSFAAILNLSVVLLNP